MEVRHARVLVVDDDPDVRASLQELLQASLHDAQVAAAADGTAALQAMAEDVAEVVVSDFRMPKMDGLELLENIREQWPDTHGILITAFPDLELALRAINQGRVHHFLLKTSEPETIVAAVEGALWDSRKRLAQQQLMRTLTRAVRSRHGTL